MRSFGDLDTDIRQIDNHSSDNIADNEIVAPARQVAALVWKQGDWGVEVLLVTSRVSGHWLLPKGWPIVGMSAVSAASQEAYEEGGAWGSTVNEPIGAYQYEKVLEDGAARPCTVDIFAIRLLGLLDDWPEKAQRRRRWFTLSNAAQKVTEPDLGRFLRQCGDQLGIEQPEDAVDTALTSRYEEPIVQPRERDVISAAQCRAALGLVDWTIGHLAETSGIPVEDLSAFERGGELDPATATLIMRSLEGAGARFLPESRGRGAGVRLKFARQTVKRIDIWENEGGPTADDDIR